MGSVQPGGPVDAGRTGASLAGFEVLLHTIRQVVRFGTVPKLSTGLAYLEGVAYRYVPHLCTINTHISHVYSHVRIYFPTVAQRQLNVLFTGTIIDRADRWQLSGGMSCRCGGPSSALVSPLLHIHEDDLSSRD